MSIASPELPGRAAGCWPKTADEREKSGSSNLGHPMSLGMWYGERQGEERCGACGRQAMKEAKGRGR